MKIRRLEIQGFKSFADRTSFAFGDGITGIVGPNGCGKSNVVDAIRWLMGEMSAKQLRGRGMQDVIFAGSENRGPMGMAEATLTLRNDGDVPPQYASYGEIAVTRRLHRDGTSEYLINKTPVRLRDVTDLFLGTGVGTRAYAIIEQGRIGFVVNCRPEDRRSLIEEVAGITKFKARKKAAERRLSATEQNLLRVHDILGELSRQLGSLRRQAKKAERYKRFKEELRDLDLHAAAMEYLRLLGQEKVLQAERVKLEEQLVAGQISLDTKETGLESDRIKLEEQERSLQQQQAELSRLETGVAALEKDLTHWKGDCVDAKQRGERALADQEAARERIGQSEHQVEQLSTTIEELKELSLQHEGRVEALAAVAEAHQSALAGIDDEIESLRAQSLEQVHGAAQQRAQAANLRRQHIELRDRLERALVDQQHVEPRLIEAKAQQARWVRECEQVEQDLITWRATREGHEVELVEIRERLAASEAGLSRLKETLGERRSRLSSLAEIARRLEGYSDGVRALLGEDADTPRWGEGVLAGVRGLVADVLEVPPAHERAIEAVLGERLQYLIAEGLEPAERAILHLRASQGGRSGFVPLVPNPVEAPADPGEHAGIVGRALDLVTAQDGFLEAVRVLLHDVLVVKDLEAACAIAQTSGSLWCLVTLEGDVLAPTGLLSGGSSEGAGLLAKRREIRELTGQVAALEQDLEAATESHLAMERQRLQLEVDVQQLGKEIHAGELARTELVKDAESGLAEVQRLEERLEVLGHEVEQYNEDLQGVAADEQAAQEAAEQAEASKQTTERLMAELQARRQEQAGESAERGEELTALRVHLAAQQEKLTAAMDTRERLLESLGELEERVAQSASSIETCEHLQEELGARIAAGEQERDALVTQAQTAQEALSQARAAYEAEREQATEITQALREARRTNESVQQQIMDCKMELQRLALENRRLIEQMAERHDVILPQALGDYHLRPMPGEQEAERRETLERTLKSIGPINLMAIEECSEVESRHTFLQAQQGDLVAALEALKKAISSINRASRERFQHAFEAVNEMFQQVFPRLFRGGEARLELVEAEDLLEAGVEIIVQPPGKRLQSLNLLSGGEKALTATALVFAIFLVKPSPFCVLDEVDAPLDEVNVGRFNDMLKEVSALSQFIVITHNKATMQQTDRLYGVTMEEPGLSKVVSVDLAEAEDQAA